MPGVDKTGRFNEAFKDIPPHKVTVFIDTAVLKNLETNEK
jgi:hypothetical protein